MNQHQGTLSDQSIFSEKLGEEVELLIYLPASFSPLYKYHVLIAQDGIDYFQLGRIGRVADDLLKSNEIERLIIVGVKYKNIEDRWEKYHPSGKQFTAYLQFLAQELVPFLDREFPTYQMGMGRGLIGDSLAGTVSLLAALQYPHTFGQVALHSPYINKEVLLAVSNRNHPSLLNIYHIIGDQETKVPTTKGMEENFLAANRELSALIKEKGFPYFYEEFQGGHTWTYWQQDIKRTLTLLFKKQ